MHPYASPVSVAAGWGLVPLVLVALVVGHGLAFERLARVELPGPLVPAVGLATLIVVANALTTAEATAPAAAPLAAVLAVAGVVFGRRRLTAVRPSAWYAVAATAVFVAFAMPSLLATRSIAGYLKLDDSATWLAVTERLLAHGREFASLPMSSLRRTLETWTGSGYPTGGFLPLGVAARLSGVDPAAAYQAVTAVYAVVLALGVAAVVRPLTRRPTAALIGALAANASLFYGYAQWGGIKEAAAAALLPSMALAGVVSTGWPVASAVALGAVTCGALLATLGLNGAAWVAPAALVFIGLRWHANRRLQSRPGWGGVGGLVMAMVIVVAVVVPLLATSSFVAQTTKGGAVTRQSEVANLLRPLPLLEGAGLWPRADFRLNGGAGAATVWLAIVCLLGAVAAMVVSVRRHRFAPVAYLTVVCAGAVPAVWVGSPWIDAKALALVAPAVLGGAALFTVLLRDADDGLTRTLGTIALVAIVAGTAWSSILAGANVYVAPRSSFTELRALAAEIGSGGPTLVLDDEIYANRYFLREADADGATDVGYRPVRRRDGSTFPPHASVDVDDVAPQDLARYRTLVRRRSPVASRPPADFRRTTASNSWEVWTRQPTGARTLLHVPLGGSFRPAAQPDCTTVARVAATAGASALVAALAPRTMLVPLRPSQVPTGWTKEGGTAPEGDGTVRLQVRVQHGGTYRLWVAGAVLGTLRLDVDEHPAGQHRHELSHAGQWMAFDVVRLAPGPHRLTLRYRESALRQPGFPVNFIGPVALAPTDTARLVTVPVDQYRTLCDGRVLDWIEAVSAKSAAP
ncbi:MAG: hypothetical protein QOE35_1661 [Actinomycetota bacterium]|jgi:hypothetical protein